MGQQPKQQVDLVLNELVAIKRLLICGLLRSGASQNDVAKALGISQATISRMFVTNGLDSSKKSAPRPEQ